MMQLTRIKLVAVVSIAAMGTLIVPSPAQAQDAPASFEQVIALVQRKTLSSALILAELRQTCIGFQLDAATEARLRNAGADNLLIEGLRPPSVCYRGPYNARRAALQSLVVPGTGQFYTRRPLPGFAFLSLAGGALAFGLLSERTTIECLGVARADMCEGAVRSETTERPYLIPGIGAAVAIAAFSAVDAARGARRSNERAGTVAEAGENSAAPSRRARLTMPAIRSAAAGIAIEVVRVRF